MLFVQIFCYVWDFILARRFTLSLFLKLRSFVLNLQASLIKLSFPSYLLLPSSSVSGRIPRLGYPNPSGWTFLNSLNYRIQGHFYACIKRAGSFGSFARLFHCRAKRAAKYMNSTINARTNFSPFFYSLPSQRGRFVW